MVNTQATARPNKKKDGLSAALLEDLTIQRTAALRAELAARPDIALITVTHNLVAQIFYEPIYGLPSSLTVRTDAYAERVDLRSASESQAANALAKRTHDLRQLLPAKIDALWEWLLEQPQNVLLNVLATAAAHTVNAVQGPHDEPSTAAEARQMRWLRRWGLICLIGGRPPPRITSGVSRKTKLSKRSERRPKHRLMSA
jgi:hypothetical protein